MRRRTIVLVAVAAVAVAAALVVGLRHQQRPGAAAAVYGSSFKRFAAPTLPSRTLAGRPFSLTAYRGKPLAIVFFASWCDPCKAEAPGLSRFTSAPGAPPVVGVAVADRASDARGFVRHYGWRFPIVLDGDGSIAADYGVVGPPQTMIVDGRGEVVQKVFGGVTPNALRRLMADASRA